MKQSVRIGTAATLALIAAGATFLIQNNRDLFFLNEWREPSGTFTKEEVPALAKGALGVASQLHTGATCVQRWAGRDDTYIYLALGCGRFREENGKIVVEGDQSFKPTRLRYDTTEVWQLEQVDERNFENSLRRLFPRPAGDRVRVLLDSDTYKKMGLAKTKEPKGA